MPEASLGDLYSLLIVANGGDFRAKKSDPFAVCTKVSFSSAEIKGSGTFTSSVISIDTDFSNSRNR